MPRGVFVSSTGTSSGKTFVARGIAAQLCQQGIATAAIKPLETGCTPNAADAAALGKASGATQLADATGLYRAQAAVAPYAATLLGESAPDFHQLVERVIELAETFEVVIVEGAGGLLVPIDQMHDVADLAGALALPVLLVAPNRLGVLSHVRSAFESATRRRLRVAGVVLTEPDPHPDASSSTNAQILKERLQAPIVQFPHCDDDDAALAAAAEASGLMKLVR